MRKCPFETVYNMYSLSPLDFKPLSNNQHYSTDEEENQEVVWAISCNNLNIKLRYKTKFDKHCRLHTFREGDLVRIHMQKEQFFNQPNANDSLTDDGLFKVVHKTDIFTR